MRCKKHHSDFSSSVGVCASCLRERLVSIIAAQAHAEKQSELFRSGGGGEGVIRAADDPLPPPLLFFRSVSPYVPRTKSDEDLWRDLDREGNRRHRHQRFYSTPQVGPNCRTNNSANTTFVTTGSFDDRKPKSKFSLWSKLFRSRSEKFEKNRESHGRESSSSSPSWFSTIFNNNRRTKQQQSSLSKVEESIAVTDRRIERGMSPARLSDSDEECEGPGRSPISQKFHQSPMAALGSAKRGRFGNKQTASASGFAFCLSPLVRARAGPNRNWNQKVTPPEVSFSGGLVNPAKPHLCANRSRKIADFGRVNHNR